MRAIITHMRTEKHSRQALTSLCHSCVDVVFVCNMFSHTWIYITITKTHFINTGWQFYKQKFCCEDSVSVSASATIVPAVICQSIIITHEKRSVYQCKALANYQGWLNAQSTSWEQIVALNLSYPNHTYFQGNHKHNSKSPPNKADGEFSSDQLILKTDGRFRAYLWTSVQINIPPLSPNKH